MFLIDFDYIISYLLNTCIVKTLTLQNDKWMKFSSKIKNMIRTPLRYIFRSFKNKINIILYKAMIRKQWIGEYFVQQFKK